jgi:molybdate transport system ATP-binding protein
MVLIARAMVKSPRLLILDEPCSGLDAANRRTVLNLVESIGLSGQTGLLFVTHHEQEMPGCITHRLALDKGRVVGCGAIGDELSRPQAQSVKGWGN